MLFPDVEKSVYEAEEKGGLPSAFARIRAYRGEADFTGIHEYYVICPHCGEDLDFPVGNYVARFLRLRCGACDNQFLGEVVRTNLSLRFYRSWTKRDLAGNDLT